MKRHFNSPNYFEKQNAASLGFKLETATVVQTAKAKGENSLLAA